MANRRTGTDEAGAVVTLTCAGSAIEEMKNKATAAMPIWRGATLFI
jgi:hypothetical protein